MDWQYLPGQEVSHGRVHKDGSRLSRNAVSQDANGEE